MAKTKTKIEKKTISFDKLMNCVRYVDTPLGDRYVLTLDGKRKIFKDTDEVIPYANEQGYKVMLNGEEM